MSIYLEPLCAFLSPRRRSRVPQGGSALPWPTDGGGQPSRAELRLHEVNAGWPASDCKGEVSASLNQERRPMLKLCTKMYFCVVN